MTVYVMALAPNNYCSVDTIRDVQFSLKSSCTVCMEAFDSRVHIPKVLVCGHSICVNCIGSILLSAQPSDAAGEPYLVCPICRRAMEVYNGASGFPTNHQLLDAIAPQDVECMTCSSCKEMGSEKTFHICRECNIETNKFDIQTILDVEPPMHPDAFAICSTCILKHHNTESHTVIEYFPVRVHYQFTRNMKSVDTLKAQMTEKFCEVRLTLSTIPTLLKNKETVVDKFLDLMQRAKSRKNHDAIFKKYKRDVNSIIKILDTLKTEGGKLNELVSEKVKSIEMEIEEIGARCCFSEIMGIKEILKTSKHPLVSKKDETKTTTVPNEEQFVTTEQHNTPKVNLIMLLVWCAILYGVSCLFSRVSSATAKMIPIITHGQELITAILSFGCVAVFISISSLLVVNLLF